MNPRGSGPGGALYWGGVLAGGAVMAYGIVGVLTTGGISPVGLAMWVIGLAVVHDALLAPAEYLAGVTLARRVLGRRRAPLQVALLVGTTLTIYALPFVFAPGRLPDNPSLLPGRYGLALVGLLAAIGLVTGGVIWLTTRRRRRSA